MFNKLLEIQIKPSTKLMVVSDIHLQLPITRELEIIQASLVSRINELGKSKDAILVLNGDVIELWEKHNQSVEDILSGFDKLSESIAKFAKKSSHRVIYTVGNHDDVLSLSAGDRKIVEKIWNAEICRSLAFMVGKKAIRIEHGHESDSYNATSQNNNPKGKQMVQNTLPVLLKTMPSLFSGIGDVVNRSLLPSYVLSNLTYKIIAPICAPAVLMISILLSITNNDSRYWKSALLVLVLLWAVLLISDVILRFIAGFALGGGSSYMKKVDNYRSNDSFDVIVYGHTHQGVVEKRKGYVYANGGCNDVIALPRIGWIGLIRFNRFVQLSNISIEADKKDFIKYHQQIVPLVE